MTIGILVDGRAEFESLPSVLRRINSPHQLQGPLLSDIQPCAPCKQIALTICKRLPILATRGASRVLVLLDRETEERCCPEFAAELEAEIGRRYTRCEVRVVVKNSRYENWLVADRAALQAQPKRFPRARLIERQVCPDKADSTNALALLQRVTPSGDSYSKVADASRIMKEANPYTIATNSRSFRRFLRLLDDPAYATGSRLPAR